MASTNHERAETLVLITVYLFPRPSTTTDLLQQAAVAEEVAHIRKSVASWVLRALSAVVHGLVVLALLQSVVRNGWPLAAAVARTPIKEPSAFTEVILEVR
jgi:hypothetical protein